MYVTTPLEELEDQEWEGAFSGIKTRIKNLKTSIANKIDESNELNNKAIQLSHKSIKKEIGENLQRVEQNQKHIETQMGKKMNRMESDIGDVKHLLRKIAKT